MKAKEIIKRFNKLWAIFWTPEDVFEKEYLERRVKDITLEIMNIPVKDRLKFIKSIEGKILTKTLEEKVQLRAKMDEIDQELKNYEKI